MMSVYVDDASRVMGFNPNDMTGNTGWVLIDDDAIQRATGAAPEGFWNELRDWRDIARWKLVDGEIVARTPEEMDADYVPPPAPPIDPVVALSEQVDDMTLLLADMIGGGMV